MDRLGGGRLYLLSYLAGPRQGLLKCVAGQAEINKALYFNLCADFGRPLSNPTHPKTSSVDRVWERMLREISKALRQVGVEVNKMTMKWHIECDGVIRGKSSAGVQQQAWQGL